MKFALVMYYTKGFQDLSFLKDFVCKERKQVFNTSVHNRWDSITRYSLVLLFTVLSNSVFAQVKYEREFRVERITVPENAVGFVDSLKFPTKIKWYKESGLSNITYEAKTKYEGAKYSIEFSENGAFEDLEIEIKQEVIPSSSFSAFTSYLDSTYTTYRIKKIQLQYTGSPKAVLSYFDTGEDTGDLTRHYEMVLSAKVEGVYQLFEYLFSESGKFIQKVRVALSSTDNIEY